MLGCQESGYVCELGAICLSLCTSMSPHMSIHPHTSRGHLYIYFSISSSIACQQLYSCRPAIPVDQHHFWSLAVSHMTGLGTYVFWTQFFISVLLSVWTGCLQMYAQVMCCRLVLIVLFLCRVFIMSQASATITTASVTVVCSGTSSLLITLTMAPTLMGYQ